MQEMDKTEQAVYDSLMPEYHTDEYLRYIRIDSLVAVVKLFVGRMRDVGAAPEDIEHFLIPLDRQQS